MPFSDGDNEALPFSEPQDNADIVLTAEMWNNITYEIGKQCPPLIGILGSASGQIENGTLVIRIGSEIFCNMCTSTFSEQIHKAVAMATGRNIRVRFI